MRTVQAIERAMKAFLADINPSIMVECTRLVVHGIPPEEMGTYEEKLLLNLGWEWRDGKWYLEMDREKPAG